LIVTDWGSGRLVDLCGEAIRSRGIGSVARRDQIVARALGDRGARKNEAGCQQGQQHDQAKESDTTCLPEDAPPRR
jgi:hypothetical protein